MESEAKALRKYLSWLCRLPMLLQSNLFFIYSRSGICVDARGRARDRVLIFSQKKIAIFKSPSFQPSIICKLIFARTHRRKHIVHTTKITSSISVIIICRVLFIIMIVIFDVLNALPGKYTCVCWATPAKMAHT